MGDWRFDRAAALMSRLVALVVVEVCLVACFPSAPTPTVVIRPTSLPANSLLPSVIQATASTDIPLVVTRTPVPQPSVSISAENAERVVQLARWDTGMVYEVAWAPDGRLLAVVSSQGIHLYDTLTLAAVRFIETDAIGAVFSPDGLILASAGGYRDDNAVRLWQVSDGTLMHALKGHTVPVFSVAFSPDGSTLASGSQDETVRLWRVSDGKLLRTLEGHVGLVNMVAFSSDGSTLASASGDQTVRLWRVSDGSILRTLGGHTGAVLSAAFSPDGSMLASGSFASEVRLWQVSSGAHLRTLEEHAGSADSVAFSPDGSVLASVSDWKVLLWSVGDGAFLHTLDGPDYVRSVAFSPDGLMLASGTIGPAGGTVQLWGIDPSQP